MAIIMSTIFSLAKKSNACWQENIYLSILISLLGDRALPQAADSMREVRSLLYRVATLFHRCLTPLNAAAPPGILILFAEIFYLPLPSRYRFWRSPRLKFPPAGVLMAWLAFMGTPFFESGERHDIGISRRGGDDSPTLLAP